MRNATPEPGTRAAKFDQRPEFAVAELTGGVFASHRHMDERFPVRQSFMRASRTGNEGIAKDLGQSRGQSPRRDRAKSLAVIRQ